MRDDTLGKKAEEKVWNWLDRKENGYSFDRLYDQMTGYYMVSRNPCDFICYKYPYMYYIESKATHEDRFEFNMITDTQYEKLLEKSKIKGCYGLVVVLFAYQKRAFMLHIEDIDALQQAGKHSINITKIDKWTIPYKEIRTIPNPRKELLDYEGEIEEYV